MESTITGRRRVVNSAVFWTVLAVCLGGLLWLLAPITWGVFEQLAG